jgi:hypothetical protein
MAILVVQRIRIHVPFASAHFSLVGSGVSYFPFAGTPHSGDINQEPGENPEGAPGARWEVTRP